MNSRRQRFRVTDSAVRLVRGLSVWHKAILAAAAIVAVLYSGITFIIRNELERLEHQRQKIGRKEYAAYKERTAEEMKEIKAKLEKLDDKVDAALRK